MITRAEVEKLGAPHALEPTMLSLYLAVPPRPAPLSLLAARAAPDSPRHDSGRARRGAATVTVALTLISERDSTWPPP